MATQPRALAAPLQDFNSISAYEASASFVFPRFTAATAWELGNALRQRILALPDTQRRPSLISIARAGHKEQHHVLFQAVTEPGTHPDNEVWARRKRNTVLRWGMSTWAFRKKVLETGPVGTDESNVELAWIKKYGMASYVGGTPDEFCIYGGGVPVKVDGVDGVVAVISVSGLRQEDDHQVIIEVIGEFLEKRPGPSL
ncbi:hypothetical protein BJX65DRAFT_314608 [Aspergillus insuetus]